MDLDMIVQDIREYVEQEKTVTLFQVMVEKNYSYYDVRKAFDLCIDEGFIIEKEDEVYAVVPLNKRITVKEKLRRKIKRILDSLFEKEINFLKEATENHSRSQAEAYCRINDDPFLDLVYHFQDVHLFVKEGNSYKLALSEQEYLIFWEMLGDYPKEYPKMKRTWNSSSARRHSTQKKMIQQDLFNCEEEKDQANKSEESETREDLAELHEESADQKRCSVIDGDAWSDDDQFADIEIRQFILKNKNHSRLELIDDIEEDLAEEGSFRSSRCESLKLAILNLKMMDDKTFETLRKQYVDN